MVGVGASCADAITGIKAQAIIRANFIGRINARENRLRNYRALVDWRMNIDAIAKSKEAQRQGRKHFAPLQPAKGTQL